MATYAASEAVVGPRDFARVINNIFLSINFIGRVKKKRNDVTEIVSELEIADVTFRRYDRKYVCCSQASARWSLKVPLIVSSLVFTVNMEIKSGVTWSLTRS